MKPDPPRRSPRKVKYDLKRPPSRPKPQPKSEVAASDDDVDDEIRSQELLRKVNDHLARRKPPQAEQKSSVQVAFTHGGASSSSLRTFGKQNEGACGRTDMVESIGCSLSSKLGTLDLSSVGIFGDIVESSENTIDFPKKSNKRDYRELWDYQHSYYPTTLPLRRPYSGDPELLDKEEFGVDGTSSEYDENAVNSASDLGLLDESDDKRMIFFQFPDNIRFSKQTPTPDGRVASNYPRQSKVEDVAGSSKHVKVVGSSVSGGTAAKSSIGSGNLESSPSGLMGKMLVYKSGAVKFKMGDVLYDVSPGSTRAFPEDVVTINTTEKQYAAMGEISNHAIISPDIDFLLDPQPRKDAK